MKWKCIILGVISMFCMVLVSVSASVVNFETDDGGHDVVANTMSNQNARSPLYHFEANIHPNYNTDTNVISLDFYLLNEARSPGGATLKIIMTDKLGSFTKLHETNTYYTANDGKEHWHDESNRSITSIVKQYTNKPSESKVDVIRNDNTYKYFVEYNISASSHDFGVYLTNSITNYDMSGGTPGSRNVSDVIVNYAEWIDTNSATLPYDTSKEGTNYVNSYAGVLDYYSYSDVDRYIHFQAKTICGRTITKTIKLPGFKYYNIQYNANGGTGKPANSLSRWEFESSTISNVIPSRTHYSFTGWNTNRDGSGNGYKSGQTVNGRKEVLYLYAQWTPNTYTLTYDKNSPTNASVGNSDVTLSATNKKMKYEQNWGTLATATKPGYVFEGWYTAKSGGTKVTANTPVNGDLTVYAHWKPITYTVRFYPNEENGFGTVTGTMNNVLMTYDKAMKLPKNVYAKTTITPPEGVGEESVVNKSVFRGWNESAVALKAGYSDEATVMNLTKSNNAIVDLYAIWDDTPNFEFAEYPDRFFSLEEAQNGYITEEKLLETVKVRDRETKVLPTIPSDKLTGTEKGYVTVVGYDPDEYTQLTDDGTVSVRYKVVDEVGNKAYLNVKIYITRNGAMPTELVEYYRSISDDYAGRLVVDSRWVMEDVYREVLNQAFTGDIRPYVVKVSSNELSDIREYVETNGFGNSKRSDMLLNLFNLLFH